MQKINIIKIITCVSLFMFILTLSYGIVHICDSKPYIEKDSITYHLNEDMQITSLEITITNPSLKVVENKDFFLRYCREDNYPEGYSSAIVFSIAPLESKTITINNFRNIWVFNDNYHIELDYINYPTEDRLSIENSKPTIELFLASAAIFPSAIITSLIGIIFIAKHEKLNKNK